MTNRTLIILGKFDLSRFRVRCINFQLFWGIRDHLLNIRLEVLFNYSTQLDVFYRFLWFNILLNDKRGFLSLHNRMVKLYTFVQFDGLFIRFFHFLVLMIEIIMLYLLEVNLHILTFFNLLLFLFTLIRLYNLLSIIWKLIIVKLLICRIL